MGQSSNTEPANIVAGGTLELAVADDGVIVA